MKGKKKLDAVFEGGGVKGIGLVGAVKVAKELGYEFENMAGTSAGAIVASLVAAGYEPEKLKKILDDLDYMRFKDKGLVDRIPLVGPLLSLGFEKGIYEGEFFESWLRELLSAQGVHTFGDLVIDKYRDDPRYRWKLQVIAADLTNGRMLRLPSELEHYGLNPDEFEVARAVRMSMSIPFFFEPVELEDNNGHKSIIVDGGVLSNFPVWIFDDGTSDPPWPTVGFKLVDNTKPAVTAEQALHTPRSIRGPISLLAALFTTMMEAHDKLYIEDSNFARTIPIPTVGVGTIEFDLSKGKAAELYSSGQQAAKQFFEKWNFDNWKTQYRTHEAPGRQNRLLKNAGC